MKVIADFCIVPLGVGTSLSPYIAAAIDEFEAAGLEYETHAYGTNVSGDYDQVFRALKKALQKVHDLGAPRITCTIKLGTRTDREQSMQDKIESVAKKRHRATR